VIQETEVTRSRAPRDFAKISGLRSGAGRHGDRIAPCVPSIGFEILDAAVITTLSA